MLHVHHKLAGDPTLIEKLYLDATGLHGRGKKTLEGNEMLCSEVTHSICYN